MIDGWLVVVAAAAVGLTLWVLHRFGDRPDPPDE